MKTPLSTIFFLLISFTAFSQYRVEFGEHEMRYTQQSDSVYKVNKVKVRATYRIDNTARIKKKKLAEFTFDEQGRVTSLQYDQYVNGQLRTTHYTYDSIGRIKTMKDVFIKGEPNPGWKELIDEDEVKRRVKLIPDRAEHNYVITYRGDSLATIVSFNEKGEKERESIFSRRGLVHEFRDEKDGAIGHRSTTRYLDNRQYKFLPVNIVLAFTGSKPNETGFEYRFDEHGLLVERIEYKKMYTPFSAWFRHDDKGLLVAAGGDTVEDVVFEYQFYK